MGLTARASAGRLFMLAGVAFSLAACGGQGAPQGDSAAGRGAGSPNGDSTSPAVRPAIVFLGTSLTAGYGLGDPTLAYPALIERRVDSLGLGLRVINAGVSGETSAGALRRIDWVMSQGPIAVLVIETGANDGLRGQDPDTVKANIQAIIDRAKQSNPAPAIIITGMEALPNLGAAYTARFRAIFADLAKKNGALLVPFLLEGVAGVDTLNQEDGIHPNPRGQEMIAETVWGVLEGVLAKR